MLLPSKDWLCTKLQMIERMSTLGSRGKSVTFISKRMPESQRNRQTSVPTRKKALENEIGKGRIGRIGHQSVCYAHLQLWYVLVPHLCTHLFPIWSARQGLPRSLKLAQNLMDLSVLSWVLAHHAQGIWRPTWDWSSAFLFFCLTNGYWYYCLMEDALMLFLLTNAE